MAPPEANTPRGTDKAPDTTLPTRTCTPNKDADADRHPNAAPPPRAGAFDTNPPTRTIIPARPADGDKPGTNPPTRTSTPTRPADEGRAGTSKATSDHRPDQDPGINGNAGQATPPPEEAAPIPRQDSPESAAHAQAAAPGSHPAR
jgi:hypothetical protein